MASRLPIGGPICAAEAQNPRLPGSLNSLDELTLRAWVGGTEIQNGTLGELLTPDYWLDVLRQRKLDRPGTVLLSGTIPMHADVDQFADAWRVELADKAAGELIELAYEVRRLPDPIG